MTKAEKPEVAEMTETEGESHSMTIARLRLNPIMRHATTANAMAAATVKFDGAAVSALDSSGALSDLAGQVAGGDLRPVSDFLLAQAVMLDSTVTEMMRRAWQNASEYPDAFRSYMGLALKAQAQSRASLESLARIHQPREQIVRHVHVNEGGQAIVADQVTIGGPGGGNAAIADQSHTAGTTGTSERTALPSPDALGNGLQIPSSTRETEMPDARRDEPRRTPRQRQRAQARPEDSGDGEGP